MWEDLPEDVKYDESLAARVWNFQFELNDPIALFVEHVQENSKLG